MIKISIIIPCYNCERFIARAIISVISQNLSDWELLLINNNSTDNTQIILDKYALLYPQQVKVFNEIKKGAPAARNKGLHEAKGEYIQFLDADDELLPTKIEFQYQLAKERNALLVASPYRMIGMIKGKHINQIRGLYTNDPWITLINSRMGITSSNLWSRRLLLAVGGWDENLIASQEYELMFRIMQTAPVIAFDNRTLTIVHIEQGESVSRGGDMHRRQLVVETRINLRLNIKNYLINNNLLNNERQYFIDKFIYKTLIKSYRYWPEWILEKLRLTNVRVTYLERAKGMLFMRKMDLRKVLARKELNVGLIPILYLLLEII
jgi:glycosyltransferase involved in cell wall biosynthesis